MSKIRSQLLGYGIVLCPAGIVFPMASTTLIGAFVSSIPQHEPAGLVIIEFITTVIASCVVPLGTAMIAISIALGMLGGRLGTDAAVGHHRADS